MPDATDNRILSQLMLLQGTLDSMPTDESISRFVSRGLKSVPGVSSLKVCVRGAIAEKNDLCPSCNYQWGKAEDNVDHLCRLGDDVNTKRFPIRTADHLYGFVVFSLSDTPDAFTPYEPYLHNIANVIALSIDSTRQRQALEVLNKQLQGEMEYRKRAEEKRKLSEERLIEAQAVAKVGSWETELLTSKVIWSEETYRIFEIDPDSFQSSHPSFLEFVHPEDRAKVDAAFIGSMDKHSPNTIEHRIVTPGGLVKFIEERWHIFYDNQGIPVRAVGTCQDITERKQSEKALRESELLWRLSIDHMIEAYALHEAIFDETGRMVDYRFLQFNPAAQKISNIAREEIIGKTALELYPHIVERGLLDRYADVMATGVPAIINDFYYVGDKLDKAFDISCFRIDDQHFVCLFRDITERKQAEEERRRLERELQQLQKSESLSRMAGAIAHHFNNQLGAVIGNLDLAMMNKPSGASGPDETLTEAMKSAIKAAEMSGLMLTYLGQTHDKHEPLDLSGACNSSLRMIKAAMPKDVVLKTDLPLPGPTVKASENQIQQVLINLVNNAWEGMGDSRSAINITIKTVSPGDIPVMHRFPIDWKPQENDYACLEVADAGCGIEDNDIENLFDPFYSSKFTGRGLGLAVVLGILRSHRGAVTVESEPGKGSIFRVFLPVSAEEVSRHPEEAAEAPKQEEGGTILLVEDEQAMRKMAMTMLTFMGYTVLEAADGAEAVGIFQQHKDEIRCVLCDLTMPGMDGWETLAALRKLSPDIPFILASGYDKAKVMSGDHAEWPQAFLGKPYMLNGLSDAIRLAMAKRSGELVARGRERRKS